MYFEFIKKTCLLEIQERKILKQFNVLLIGLKILFIKKETLFYSTIRLFIIKTLKKIKYNMNSREKKMKIFCCSGLADVEISGYIC